MTSLLSSAGGPYGLRDIRSLYPAVTENHLRYLEKWGLVRQSSRTRDVREYSFADLLTIKQVAAELERGTPLRVVLRSLLAERQGQLELDFASPHAASDTPRAKVVEGSRLDDGDERNMEGAATAYRRALLIDPDLVPAIVNLANIRYARDELIEAQALYERAIGLDPDCFEAHFNLGNIQHDLGRYDRALVCYRDAVALNPGYPDAHFYLAVTLEKGGYSQEAKPHWKAYQELAPKGEWVELAKEFLE